MSKEIYSKPRMIVYGSISEITGDGGVSYDDAPAGTGTDFS